MLLSEVRKEFVMQTNHVTILDISSSAKHFGTLVCGKIHFCLAKIYWKEAVLTLIIYLQPLLLAWLQN